MTNKKARMKALPLIFEHFCSTHAVVSWLLYCRLVIGVTRVPKFIYSDPGSQIMGAKRILDASKSTEEQQLQFDLQKAAEETADREIEWRTAPAESQWRDGRSEKAISSIKKTLKHLHSGSVLNLREFQILLKRAADASNNKPLGVRATGGAEPGYAPITPNLLLKSSRTEYMHGGILEGR